MVVKGQIKTRPLKQWSVARAFNLQLKRKMDEAGIEIPVPQMRIFTSEMEARDEAADEGLIVEPQAAMAGSAGLSRAPAHEARMAPARDVSHESRPAPPSTGPAPIAPQIPTAGEGG
jgi:moderate conductance mechanosensitive channel